MSDTGIFTSYLVKLAKENLAKLIMYIVLAVLAISFLKWLIFGGFGILFTGFFKLIGLGGNDDTTTIKQQEVAIVQLEGANKQNSETIGVLQQSNENTQTSLQESYETELKNSKAYDEVRNKGQKAFNKASKGGKKPSTGGSGANGSKPTTEPSTEPDPLEDPQSPESLELAAAQYAMISDAFCIASPGSCAK